MKPTPSLHPSAARAGALLLIATLAGCSASNEPNPQGNGGKTSGGAANSGGTTTSSGGSASGGTNASSGGSAQGGTQNNSNGGSSNGGNSSGGSSKGGSSNGGSSNGGGPASGGSSSGGGASGGSATSGGANGGGASGASSAGAGGQTSGGGCPSGVTWCSGFEDSALPTGAVYKLNGDPATPWTHDFEVDTTQHKSGKSSLRVKSAAEASGAYKMLAVPSGGAAFWVRFYIRSDVDLGASDHKV